MAVSLEPIPPTAAPGCLVRLVRAARLSAAFVITLLVVLVAQGWLLTWCLVLGRLEWGLVAALTVSVVLVLGLTAGVSRPARTPAHYAIAIGVVAVWVLANGILIWLFSGNLVPRAIVAPLFVVETLWALWLAWLP